MHKKLLTKSLILTILFFVLLSFCGCEKENNYYTSLKELDGLRVGTYMGMIHEDGLAEKLPNCESYYFNSYADQIEALKNDKIDFFTADRMAILPILDEVEGLTYLSEPIMYEDYAFPFSKTSERAAVIKDEFDEFLAKLKANGALDELNKKWVDDPANAVKTAQPIDFEYSGEKGELRIVTDTQSVPFSFISNNECNGFSIELVCMFASEYGYVPKIEIVDFSALIPALVSGKADTVASGLAVTEERVRAVNFSDVFSTEKVVAVVKETTKPATLSNKSIVKSFQNTFITENRWKLIVDGLAVTLKIVICSALLGSIFGFLFYLLYKKVKLLGKLFDGIAWIISGLPVVIIVMIMYYLVFGSVGISGVTVAIIAFSILMSLTVYSRLKTAMLSVDEGQAEAAYSLGCTRGQVFFRVLFPQAMEQFMPGYKTDIIRLIHETAIVGYIAVQDLTKMSDIIRARTFEAFFPLISTAIIYLLIVMVFTILLSHITNTTIPDKRSNEQIIKKFSGKAKRSTHDSEETETPQKDKQEIIKLVNVRKEYENITPLKSVTTTINKGDVISIIGPSGTGKSTLLRLINRLENPTLGQIIIDGEDITAPNYPLTDVRKKIGMVFQNFNLFGNMTVIENVCFGPIYVKKEDPQEAYRRGMELLSHIGLDSFAFSYPETLSGGQKQRAAIARTIANNPEVILFDEPTSALDPTMTKEVQGLINDLADTGYTMMIVTHDMQFARKVANRVFYLDEGGIYDDGTPDEIFMHPKKEKTEAFVMKLRDFTYALTTTHHDYYELASTLELYCHNAEIPPKQANKIQAIFDNLANIFDTELHITDKEYISLILKASYSEQTGEAKLMSETDTIPDSRKEFEAAIALILHYADDVTADASHTLYFVKE